jgi:hypothetical protein
MKIGNVRMNFDTKGDLDSITLIAHRCDIKGLEDDVFDTIKSCSDESQMVEQSKKALSHIFSLVNLIELFDRDAYYISSVPYRVDKYPDGMIKEIDIVYTVLPVDKK